MEVAVFSFGDIMCHSSMQVQSTGPVIVTRFFFHMYLNLGLQWMTMSSQVAAEQLLESEDIERENLRISIPSSIWVFYKARNNDSGASIGAARRMGSNNNSLTLIFSIGDAVKPA
ncbi:hypothetical protein TNCV_4995911 [Trichonephila clavipes]|nr:hypothetical protein TNCV_4995911 [Trichonephila clavipes]